MSTVARTRALAGQVRGLHTVTKIEVQLLKDWPGLGTRGEVVKVAPGRMRNQLHPRNGAAYVLKDKPLRIPLKSREQALEEHRLAQQAAQRELAPEPEVESATSNVLSSLGILGKTANIDNLSFLKFPTKAPADSTAKASTETYSTHAAIDSLPPAILISRKTEQSGFLSSHLTTVDVAKHLSKLTGVEINPSILSFEIVTKDGKHASKLLDHVGTYVAKFQISPDSLITKSVNVTSVSSDVKASKRPLNTPLPTGETLETASTPSEAETSTPESKGDSKTFEWENELLVKLRNKDK